MEIKLRPVYVWPSGIDWALFCAKINIEEFARNHRLPFIRHEEEGLGWYSATFFSLETIDYVGIIEYDDSAQGSEYGASIHVDMATNRVVAIKDICSAMQLNTSDLTWVNDAE